MKDDGMDLRLDTLQSKGIDADTVREGLRRRLASDLVFDSGAILGSMCSLPDSLGAAVFTDNMDKNIGDPGLHPALAELERETVAVLGAMLGEPRARGSIVTGGTEANLLALWTAKNMAGPGKREVVLPETAHFSFDKAASMMDLILKKVPVDAYNRVIPEEYARAIGPETMALVGIAGTTGLGAVDPIGELASLAREHRLFLHIDAAFGGFVLPFLEEAGYPAPAFDFRLPGVCSIAIDPHKMGRSPIPAGSILYRSGEIAEASQTTVTYLAGGKTKQQTMVGTRPGGAVAAVWAVLAHYGREGFVATVRDCMERTELLTGRLREIEGVETVIEPVINVVGIRPKWTEPERLAEALRTKGYALSLFSGFLRITVMPHLSRARIESFLSVLQETLAELSGGNNQ
jgi:tyrosine decarboxylase/aspartate 1-decarboxylase